MTSNSDFNAVAVRDMCQAIDCACAVEKKLHAVPLAAVAILGLDDNAPLARELCDLFHHHIAINPGSGPAEVGADISYVQPSDPPNVYPRPLREAPDDVIEWWRALADGVTHPLATAFLSDILFCIKDRSPGARAQQAVENYLAAAGLTALDIATQFECSLRAWTLARLMKKPTQELAARQMLASKITADLDTGTALIPGLVLPALATITAPNRHCGPDQFDLDIMLDRAIELYGTPHHIDVIADLITRWRRGDTTVSGDMRRKRVQVRLNAGHNSGDIAMKLHWYEQAARLASELGIPDLREEATSSLQALDISALPWVHIPFDATLRPHHVEGFVHQFVRTGWRQGLISWLSTDAPSGRYNTNLGITRNSLAGTIFRTLMPTWTFGAHGLPQRTSEPALEEVPDTAIRDTEYFSALLHGGMLAEALNRIGHLRATTDPQDIEAVICEYFLCDAADARILARALQLYWRGDYLAAAHLITPFAENGARRLLLLLDEPIYRVEEAKKKKIGQYLGLGALLPLLKKQGLDYDWVRYLDTLLLPDGQNYRNLIAHGFLYDIDRVTAALLIRAAALLLLMPGLPSSGTTNQKKTTSALAVRPKLSQRVRLAVSAARWAFDSTRI